MKLVNEKSYENGEDGNMAERYEDYSVQYVEPKMDDVDVKMLGLFLKLLRDTTDGSDDVNYDDLLPEPDHNAHSEIPSSGTPF